MALKPINHEWVRRLVSACTSGNSHGEDVSNQVLCHRMAFVINKHFGLETRQWNVDGDPERDKNFIDPYSARERRPYRPPAPKPTAWTLDWQYKGGRPLEPWYNAKDGWVEGSPKNIFDKPTLQSHLWQLRNRFPDCRFRMRPVAWFTL